MKRVKLGRPRLLVGIALTVVAAAGAAYWIPGSPVREIIRSKLAGRASSLEAAPTGRAVTRRAPAAAVTTAASTPGSSAAVAAPPAAVPVPDGAADAPDSSAMSASVPAPSAGLDRGPAVVYGAGGRDPFRSLLLEEPDYSLVNIEDARLVGVAWTDEQMVAMVEDRRGHTWSLRAGDRVQYGRVVSVSQYAAVFDVSFFGKSERRTLELIPKEEESQP
jgi:hypothetical protein